MPYQKIRRKRKERGLSQDEMADLLGISASAYGKLERGETRIDTDRLKQIAGALETNIFDLLENETIRVIHNGNSSNSAGSMGNDGVVIHPSYGTDVEPWKQMVEHLEEELAVKGHEINRLLGLVERLTGFGER